MENGSNDLAKIAEEMAIFDSLPRSIRNTLNYTKSNYSIDSLPLDKLKTKHKKTGKVLHTPHRVMRMIESADNDPINRKRWWNGEYDKVDGGGNGNTKKNVSKSTKKRSIPSSAG